MQTFKTGSPELSKFLDHMQSILSQEPEFRIVSVGGPSPLVPVDNQPDTVDSDGYNFDEHERILDVSALGSSSPKLVPTTPNLKKRANPRTSYSKLLESSLNLEKLIADSIASSHQTNLEVIALLKLLIQSHSPSTQIHHNVVGTINLHGQINALTDGMDPPPAKRAATE